MDTKLRIGMLIGRFYPREAGAEIQCRRLSRELIRRNNTVFVLTQSLRRLPSREIIDTIPVYRIGLPLNGRFASFTYVLRGFFRLWRLRDSFDVLHAHMASSPAVLAGIAGRLLGKPVVLKFAGSRRTGDVATSNAAWYGRLKLAFLRKTIGCFVCPSHEIKRELLSAGFPESRIAVIPNGIDIPEFRPATAQERTHLRAKLMLPAGRAVVLYTGRLEPGKGLEYLMEAWGLVENARLPSDPCLVLVGDGSLRPALERSAAGLKSVIFKGWQHNVSEYLRAADVFVLPSLGEGLPNSLLEAMACGLACAATRIGGIVEIVEDNATGVLAKPADTAQLSDALKKLLTDGPLRERIGKAARASVEERYSLAVVAGGYEELYRERVQAQR